MAPERAPAPGAPTEAPFLEELAEAYQALVAGTRDYVHKNGFETVIVRMPAPYDRETIDRMASVGDLLGA